MGSRFTLTANPYDRQYTSGYRIGLMLKKITAEVYFSQISEVPTSARSICCDTNRWYHETVELKFNKWEAVQAVDLR